MRLLLSLTLALLTFGLYWPVHRHGFIDFDDHEYVVSNAHVNDGLAWDNVRWAFTTAHMCNWHPLTWISHMSDCQWFGLDPAGHHLVNVTIHALTAVLLLLALHRLTGAVWRSAVVAALFALHPLRVESVAWVAERKDVLSGCFFMATLYAYARYVEQPNRARYLLTLAAFTGGLLSKSMLVTLPFVLLLLDFWPLNRWQPAAPRWPVFRRLLWEKVPLIALALVVSVVTVFTQSHTVTHVAVLPVFPRVANALVSYLLYLRKMAWPDDLAVFYPYRGWALWQTMSAAVVLAAISFWVIRWARRYPWLFTGWFWYLGMLVPVIGLVQVGHQAMADRYSYLPSVGITLLVVWQGAEALGRLRLGGALLTLMSAGAMAGCFVATARLLPVWQNTLTLFSHAAEVTRNNDLAQFKIGLALAKSGRGVEAVQHYLRALEISPEREEVHYHLGIWHTKQGDWDRADFHFGKALELNPEWVDPYGALGALRLRQGRVDEAIDLFQQAVKVDPRSKEAHHNLGAALSELGRMPEDRKSVV